MLPNKREFDQVSSSSRLTFLGYAGPDNKNVCLFCMRLEHFRVVYFITVSVSRAT